MLLAGEVAERDALVKDRIDKRDCHYDPDNDGYDLTTHDDPSEMTFS